MNRLSKIQVAVGATAALVLYALRIGVPQSDPALLDAIGGLSFALCCIGVLIPGRQLRLKYERLGCDKRIAQSSPEFMEMRRSLRFWSYIAALAIASLAAAAFDLPAFLTVGGLALAIPILILVTDRMAGWNVGTTIP